MNPEDIQLVTVLLKLKNSVSMSRFYLMLIKAEWNFLV